MQGALKAVIGELAKQIKAPSLTQEQIEKGGPKAQLSQCSYDESCTGIDGYKLISDNQLETIDPRSGPTLLDR